MSRSKEIMPLGYVWEKLYVAARCLVGVSPLRDQLIAAWSSGIYLLEDEAHKLPKSARDELSKIDEGLTSRDEEYQGQGKLMATVNRLTDDEALDYAHRIFDLFSQVALLHGKKGGA